MIGLSKPYELVCVHSCVCVLCNRVPVSNGKLPKKERCFFLNLESRFYCSDLLIHRKGQSPLS